ncbi:MAG: hypothetical protein LC753_01315 [Acidobacteria bacterium]|nr:hypothetical protein [Acidobacteriota bacterium]MCA1648949.1 hypothetical protein [Acidobacteriota bacterium]
MNSGAPPEPHATEVLAGIRRVLLGALLFGMIGTGIELLLIGHFEDRLQLPPLVLLASGVVVLAWHAVAPTSASVRTLQAAMVLFVVAGGVGIGLHVRGNIEFEREMYPSLEGLELIQKTMTGATPVLAPGSMVLLGVIGLAYAHGHARLRRATAMMEQ